MASTAQFVMPEEFGPGGRLLHADLAQGTDDAATSALIIEAARTKDRLDRLNRITSGDEDVWTRVFTGEGELVLKLDTAVSEQRQLSTVFRQLLAEIQRRQGDFVSSDEEDGLKDL
ncbi:hypothetical protein [Corynebacterium ulceribovis]|uniref:hypothetical protein n=1 Tax=Corynebacterium ulceribovis TaxID=487732 RepID=UPI00035C7DFA|nr:hypothetical protein [Corynebacterium ulceribovis]